MFCSINLSKLKSKKDFSFDKVIQYCHLQNTFRINRIFLRKTEKKVMKKSKILCQKVYILHKKL